jgi:hypothetical protein
VKPTLICLALASLVACGAPQRPTVRDEAAALAHVGKVVRVEGKAGNARLSAAVVGDGWVVYCLDRAEWPETQAGMPVAVQGRLEQTREFEGGRDADGGHRAGTEGGVFVLRACDVVETAPP